MLSLCFTGRCRILGIASHVAGRAPAPAAVAALLTPLQGQLAAPVASVDTRRVTLP